LAQQATVRIFAYDFESDPAEAGWQLLQFDWSPSPAKGGWISESADPHVYSLSVEDGYWQGPQFAVVPHQYYRLTFQSTAQVPGYWAAMFYNADGQMLPADHNSGIFQSDDSIDNELYFQGKADAVSARLWFYPRQPQKDKQVCVRNVTLATATEKQMLRWADRLYVTLPPVQYQPPCDRWTLIPRTIQKLQNREAVKIVILGDSIGNDTGNSPLDKLIQRQYPGSRVTVITSVRGGTGCQYYQNENRVQDYVVRYKPDLVMIIAISHGHQSEPIRSVIRQIRAQVDAEVILTTGPIAQDKVMVENYAKDTNISVEEATAIRKTFLEDVENLAAEERVEFIPLRRLWNEYMAAATQEHDVSWFMRDVTHANVRGAQVVARMLERYFAPRDSLTTHDPNPYLFVDDQWIAEQQGPQFAIPRMSAPPNIDGRFDEGEWDSAAAVSGLVSQLDKVAHPRQTVFWIGYDDQNIYIACRSTVFPEEMSPKNLTTWFDRDTSVVVGLAPSRTGRGKSPSHFLLRANIDGKLKGQEIFWSIEGGPGHPPVKLTAPNPGWTSGATVKQSIENNVWVMEMGIPLKNLKAADFKDGEQWGLLLGRDYSAADQTALTISSDWRFGDGNRHYGRAFYNNYRFEKEYGRMRLGGAEAPAVQLLDLGDIVGGNPTPEIAVKNSGNVPLTAVARCEYRSADGKSSGAPKEHTFNLKPGERAGYVFNMPPVGRASRPVADSPGDNRPGLETRPTSFTCLLTVTGSQGVLFSHEIPVRPGYGKTWAAPLPDF